MLKRWQTPSLNTHSFPLQQGISFQHAPSRLIYNMITETWLEKKTDGGGGTPRGFSSRINLQSGFEIWWMQVRINGCITKTSNTLVKKKRQIKTNNLFFHKSSSSFLSELKVQSVIFEHGSSRIITAITLKTYLRGENSFAKLHVTVSFLYSF